ncbi:hypothetical protein MC885_018560 [Smutsia gigantea]|nr:hypothetical protein MC885_018560 [Smutsia gigantea]
MAVLFTAARGTENSSHCFSPLQQLVARTVHMITHVYMEVDEYRFLLQADKSTQRTAFQKEQQTPILRPSGAPEAEAPVEAPSRSLGTWWPCRAPAGKADNAQGRRRRL